MKPKFFLIAILLIAVSIPAIYQIITPGYFPIHDDTQVIRVQQMYKSLSAGQFPVRWVPDLGYGYGYPIFNFYNPLPYYFGSSFMFFGLDALLAAKIMFIFPIILSSLTMYLFSRLLLPRRGALLAASLYVYAPYHAVQIYVRGAVAEYWAYAILPLVLYAIWKRKIFLTGLSLAALITSHNLTAFMSIPFIGILMIIQLIKMKNKLLFLISYFLFLIFGLGLSAFFWLPALTESNKTQVSQMVFEQFDPPAKHLITFNQLWTSSWGYGGSSPGTDDGLSLQLGKVHLLGGFAAIVILLYCYIVKKRSTVQQFLAKGQSAFGGNNLTIFSTISFVVSICLLLPYSTITWKSIPILAYIQFPWRFLTFASLFSSILAAWVIWKTIKVITNITNINLLRYFLLLTSYFLLLTSSFKFFQPQFKYPTSVAELTSRERILWEVSRRSDEYLPIGFIRPNSLEEALRVGNPVNQALVDKIKQPTKIRSVANFISLLTLTALLAYAVRWKLKQTSNCKFAKHIV